MTQSCRTMVFAVVGLCALVAGMAGTRAAAQGAAKIPAWVRPGLVVVYDGVSAFVANGRFSQGIQIVMTTRVTAVANGVVAAVTNVQTVGSPIGGAHLWRCTAGGLCQGDATGMNNHFWVDVAHPAGSWQGPNGEPYRVIGQAPYRYGQRTWAGVGMSYSNPASGTQYVLTYDAATGLVLQYSETNPAQQVHIYMRSATGM